ncbi:chemotaxis protein CheB [Acidisoma cladoniae]|uniref:chemotaxis protein CheB n=1 Tax=Acidisoma cladoniae TaxID=3040935 RepID=UPI00254C7773|nr:chemotaxis protein CheB [Acidisoma sp. PAMC 29798]
MTLRMPRLPPKDHSANGEVSETAFNGRAILDEAKVAVGQSADLVIGIGASAGGLGACTKLLDAITADTGMTFILIQHLDPNHESMMVELLSAHTKMTVVQAAEGMALEADHLYVIPPGTYLSIVEGAFHLSRPPSRHGARLPFDHLLQSLAEAFGPRAVSIILSGTGADGSLGSGALREKGGLTIAQRPAEAGYRGMPQSAIDTDVVDLILPVAEMPAALQARQARASAKGFQPPLKDVPETDCFDEIVLLLRTQTVYNFTLYKPGTLRRRIERRMAMLAIPRGEMGRYYHKLYDDEAELNLLAMDLLINVTSFFRDPTVFDTLSESVIPEIIRHQPAGQTIRIWVAGCSTGQEPYSLAMLFREQLLAARSDLGLQVFASDVDPEAVATAREGFYPLTIEADVSADRLARFFSKEEDGYRVSADLRASVVYTVQDVLADPPFSRLDLVSCRNLLIYLSPEAQERVIAVFRFALRKSGILLLGTSETIGSSEAKFEIISKSDRLYKFLGAGRESSSTSAHVAGGALRFRRRAGKESPLSRQESIVELGQRLVLEQYAPAAILINTKHQCLFSVGPTDRYLRAIPEQPTHDLLAMARPEVRSKLKLAINQARREKVRVIMAGGRSKAAAGSGSYRIDVQPVTNAGEDLLLVCFIEGPVVEHDAGARLAARLDGPDAGYKHDLDAVGLELRNALRDLEIMSEDHKAIDEEALSANEEFQSTNEELLASKEELQSLNEELTALNSQLRETLDRQRTTADDLQNVLYSTDVATIFLDVHLNIRFFTPETRSIFHVIPSDVGRPLADLRSLGPEASVTVDAEDVLKSMTLVEREIEGGNGAWFRRRISPYRSHDGRVEGVVITFTDITKRILAGRALEAAKQQADIANVTKSRFLAAASHDLRQPLQTLTLLQGLLSHTVEGERAQRLVSRLDDTLGAMAGMLNTLLDINQIDAGGVHAELQSFQIDKVLTRLREEFSYHALAKGLTLSVVPCGLSVRGDANLLEQIIRNFISNALKYTKHGKVLVGCRRRSGRLSIEVWDSGIGISETALKSVFQEYFQVDNAARERSRGLGLGLSIVQRLGALLKCPIHARSALGKGSVFTIDVELAPIGLTSIANNSENDVSASKSARAHLGRAILVVEDDPEVRDLLALLLQDQGYEPTTAADGIAALDVLARRELQPDLIITDYNLPNGMNGLDVVEQIRNALIRAVPAIMLTGDISTETAMRVTQSGCIQLNKPVKASELTRVIQVLLTSPAATAMRPHSEPIDTRRDPDGPVVFVVDDDASVRNAMRDVLVEHGIVTEVFSTCEAFLAAYRPGREACIVIDAYLPGMSGLALLQRLRSDGDLLPAIMITGNSDVPMAVQAMKAGASDFIEKPIGHDELIASVARALEQAGDTSKRSAWHEDAASKLAGLTTRQREIMRLVLAGHPSKNIASDLGISQRTVENHRASIMERTGTKSLPALARLALAAASVAGSGADGS